MAEDSSDKESKTEEPTEHKIRKTIEKGELPISREVALFSGVAAFTVIAFFVAYPAFAQLASTLSTFFERPDDWVLNNSHDVESLFVLVASSIAKALLPIFIIIPVLGIAAFIFQNTPRFVGNRIQPKFSRISLKKGVQRLFSKTTIIEFLKSLFKLIGASLIVYLVFFRRNHLFTEAFFMSPPLIPEFIRTELAKLLVSNCIAVALIAGFDLAWTRKKWRSDLRMSRYEVKQEYKDIEGDPLVKARMKSLARDRIRRQMMASVPQATLIVANPTHFSVALRYKPPQDLAPVVIAKGQNILALKIREIAVENDIPVIENVPLARALYKQVEVNQMIPEEFYQAVAELVRYINRPR